MVDGGWTTTDWEESVNQQVEETEYVTETTSEFVDEDESSDEEVLQSDKYYDNWAANAVKAEEDPKPVVAKPVIAKPVVAKPADKKEETL